MYEKVVIRMENTEDKQENTVNLWFFNIHPDVLVAAKCNFAV